MEIKQVKIELIKPYAKNAKKHTKKQIEQVAESIKAFGFKQPIVVDKDYVLIAGHGRVEAAKLSGMTEVPAVIASDLSAEQVKAYRLADNKLNESDWDMGMVLEELESLNIDLQILTGFDFSDAEMDLSGANREVDIDSIKDGLNAECPKCKFRFKV